MRLIPLVFTTIDYVFPLFLLCSLVYCLNKSSLWFDLCLYRKYLMDSITYYSPSVYYKNILKYPDLVSLLKVTVKQLLLKRSQDSLAYSFIACSFKVDVFPWPVVCTLLFLQTTRSPCYVQRVQRLLPSEQCGPGSKAGPGSPWIREVIINIRNRWLLSFVVHRAIKVTSFAEKLT